VVGNLPGAGREHLVESFATMTDADSQAEDRQDAALLLAIAAGDEQAFVDLYARRHADVFRFAFAMARSKSVAQDATQEVFLNVLENASRFDPARGAARGWLFGCARYVVLDRLRLERRWTDAVPELAVEHGGDAALLMEQRVERLHAALARVPVEYREVLVFCDLQEWTYAATAAVLDCPIGTVRSRLHRGRALLAALLVEGEADARTAPTEPAVLVPREVCS
jgi:RNA polymerase sigma-70 factor (ECF subfamily)